MKNKTKINHTPGPWEAPYENPKSLQYSIDGGPNIDHDVDPTNWVHVVVSGNSERLEANARLIAAAPELLEALKSLGDERLENRNVVDNAILKAIGQEAFNEYLDLF